MFFSCNIEILNNYHEVTFILWNLWTKKNKHILVAKNGGDDDFLSHVLNSATPLSNQGLKNNTNEFMY